MQDAAAQDCEAMIENDSEWSTPEFGDPLPGWLRKNQLRYER